MGRGKWGEGDGELGVVGSWGGAVWGDCGALGFGYGAPWGTMGPHMESLGSPNPQLLPFTL